MIGSVASPVDWSNLYISIKVSSQPLGALRGTVVPFKTLGTGEIENNSLFRSQEVRQQATEVPAQQGYTKEIVKMSFHLHISPRKKKLTLPLPYLLQIILEKKTYSSSLKCFK